MNTTTRKGFSVGTQVAIRADLFDVWGAAANVIAEVVDTRHAGRGAYVYTLAIRGVGGLRLVAEGVPFEDLSFVAA
jgi:hypothetical protein